MCLFNLESGVQMCLFCVRKKFLLILLLGCLEWKDHGALCETVLVCFVT